MPVVVLTILSSSPHQNGILLQSGSQNTANNALYGDMGLQEGGWGCVWAVNLYCLHKFFLQKLRSILKGMMAKRALRHGANSTLQLACPSVYMSVYQICQLAS